MHKAQQHSVLCTTFVADSVALMIMLHYYLCCEGDCANPRPALV